MQKVYNMSFSLLYSSQAKVDCITVNLMPVKAVIDDHIQRLFDALVNSLRKAINNEVNEIDTFVTSAMDTLSQRPQTVEEIGDANAKHTEFAKKKQEVGEIPSHLPPPPPPPQLPPPTCPPPPTPRPICPQLGSMTLRAMRSVLPSPHAVRSWDLLHSLWCVVPQLSFLFFLPFLCFLSRCVTI